MRRETSYVKYYVANQIANPGHKLSSITILKTVNHINIYILKKRGCKSKTDALRGLQFISFMFAMAVTRAIQIFFIW